jgi:hypothetical protein
MMEETISATERVGPWLWDFNAALRAHGTGAVMAQFGDECYSGAPGGHPNAHLWKTGRVSFKLKT